jgi:hypothetical protein
MPMVLNGEIVVVVMVVETVTAGIRSIHRENA